MTMDRNSSSQERYGSGDPYGQPTEGYADPYAVGPSSGDPYALDPYAGDPQRDAAQAGGWTPASHQPGPYQPGPHQPGPYQPGPYQPGPPQYGHFQPAPPTSGAGIAGFVVSLVSLLLCGGFASVVGIFFSVQGMKETGPSATPVKGGRGLAIAGLVINIVGLVVVLFWLAYFAVLLFAVLGTAATSGA